MRPGWIKRRPGAGPASGPSGPGRIAPWAALASLLAVAGGWIAYPVGGGGEGEAPGASGPTDASDLGEPSLFRPDAWFLPDDGLFGFVEVGAGVFRMGSDPQADPLAFTNETWPGAEPQRMLETEAFYIGRYEVTVAQFGAFAAETGYPVDDQALRRPPDHPVTGVSWTDAIAYARWLDETLREWSETPGRLSERLRSGWRVSLPTEVQWEKAARGSDGRIYPWGDGPGEPRRANYGGSTTTTPVGSFDCAACPFGLSDMSGNVWELTRSPYGPYPPDPADGQRNLDADALWVMRGGSFTDSARNVRAAVRGGVDPGARRPFIGFRVVLARF